MPINLLVHIPGTPLEDAPALEPIEFVRTIAVARIVLPALFVRLSAGRQQMPDYLQALCFLAGANSIFYGEQLLTTPNPGADADRALFEKLGPHPLQPEGAGRSAYRKDRLTCHRARTRRAFVRGFRHRPNYKLHLFQIAQYVGRRVAHAADRARVHAQGFPPSLMFAIRSMTARCSWPLHTRS